MMPHVDEVDRRLIDVSATTLGIDADLIDDGTSPATVETWTSIAHLSLIAAVEEAFSIQLSVAEIHAAQNFGALRSIVQAHVTGRTP
jgi:acyl carrier protein